jgi:hypothetical protein
LKPPAGLSASVTGGDSCDRGDGLIAQAVDTERLKLYKDYVSPLKLFTFALPENLKAGLRQVRDADGISEAEQIRRGIRMWLESKGVIKTERKRAVTRKRS